ncbi:MAG: zinc ABC transporter substrate-binding protein [Actinobacteria bacterium]|nr:zinc ABC transporter substrate-binding protein [Actinomycetota bacterium]
MKRTLGDSIVFLMVILLVATLAGCAKNEPGLDGPVSPSKKSGERLRVVTTFAPLYSFAVNVAGDVASVENLVPVGASIHTFQSRPSDIKKLALADVLIMNGVGLEAFLSDIIDSASNPDLLIVDTSRSVSVLDAQEHKKDGGVGHEERGGGDPHIWLSPKNAIRQVEAIRDAFMEADSANAKIYKKNASIYLERLRRLDVEIAESLHEVEKKDYIVFHNAYRYFELEYGLKSAAVIEEFPGKEPSPRYLKELIDLIRNMGIHIIFTEPQFSPKLINALRQELDICTAELDPIGSELSKDGYEKNMRNNLKAFLEAFAKDSGQ